MKIRYATGVFFISIIFLFVPTSYGAVYEADHLPWSGYWWPHKTGGLVTGIDYMGKPSPISKYDFVTEGSYQGKGYFYGQKYFYKRDALPWEGMCFSWAMASALENEPIQSGTFKNEHFFIGDKKALLTAAYHRSLYMSYPVDQPELFHDILNTFIAEDNSVIIIDLHTDGEIWNYPVFKFETDYTQNGNRRHYTTTIYYPRNSVAPDFVGSAITSKSYQYYFDVGSNDEITGSGWEKESIYNHPIRAYEPFSALSEGNEIQYETVKEIVDSTDDPFEPNDEAKSASPLASGLYRLISENNDFFNIEMKKGDSAKIDFTFIDEYSLGIYAYSPDGKLLHEAFETANFTIFAEDSGAYTLEIIPTNQSVPYQLSIEQRFSHQGIFPVDLSGSWVNGIAILNLFDNGGEMGRTLVSSVDRNGLVQKSYLDDALPTKFASIVEKEMKLPSTDNGYLRVDSDTPIKGLQVLSAKDNQMIGTNFIDSSSASEKIKFPLLGGEHGFISSIGIINLGANSETVIVQSFDFGGSVYLEGEFEIAPGEKIEDPSFDVATSRAKGISFSTISGRKALVGYLMFEPLSFTSFGKSIVALPSTSDSTVFAPHIAETENWRTIAAFMNSADRETVVDCRLYNIQGVEIYSGFVNLKPNQSLSGEISTIFPVSDRKEVASLKLAAEEGGSICGFTLYYTDSQNQIVGAPIYPSVKEPIFIPHIAVNGIWRTGLGVMNPKEYSQNVTFSIFDSNGNIIEKRTRFMNPFQGFRANLTSLFENAAAGSFLKVHSENGKPEICGFYSIGATDNIRIMGDLIQ